MKIEEFKKLLIVLLKDEDVETELKKTMKAKDSNNNLEEVKEKQKIIEKLEIENKKLREDILETKINLEKMRKENFEYETNVKALKSRFSELENIYKVYMELSEKTRDSLSGIFKGNSIEEFIFCGVQYQNLESLWEYIKREIIEENLNEKDKLKDIFDYFFEAHNLIYEKPLYKRTDVVLQEKFDDEFHIKVLSENASGKIKEVVFEGYINCNNQKIIKKSLVRI